MLAKDWITCDFVTRF